MNRTWVLAVLAVFLGALGWPDLAEARRSRDKDRRTLVVIDSFGIGRHRTHHRRTRVVVPWHLRRNREVGWVYGEHGGLHWAPRIGWHNLIHTGQYRPDDGRVFIPLDERDFRFRGRF